MVLVRGRVAIGLLVLVALAEALAVVGGHDEWLGETSATASRLGQGLLLAAPATAAAGAWLTCQQHHDGFRMLAATAVVDRITIWRRAIVEVSAVAVLGFLVAASLAHAWTAAVSGALRPSLSMTVAYGGFLVCFAVAGSLLGRIQWPMLAVPLAAVGSYLVLGTLVYLAPRYLAALTPFDTRSMTYYRIPWWISLTQAVFLLAVAGVGYFAFSASRGRLVSCAWLASLSAAALLFVGTANRVFDVPAAELSCSEAAGVEVCLPRVKAFNTATVRDVVLDVRATLPGLVPERIALIDDEAAGVDHTIDEELAGAQRRASSAGALTLTSSTAGILGSDARVDRNRLVVTLAHQFIGLPRGDLSIPGSSLSRGTPSDFLLRYTLEELDIPTDGSAFPAAPVVDAGHVDYSESPVSIDEFADWSRARKSAWFAEHRAEIANGSLQWDDFTQ
ncbi:MAG TPA: hypothetical protein PLZ93_11140 [Nocardioides sp.]|uniref:hypothetical protein n=1 Tax=uncultured Nocardioides sp. TaxID=198441 RepID=UPI00263A0E97|nr:hypothetical protein [uncultured Nocardioides sp.]HRI96161.1 hypothetical protein [Nocardioides sp.]